MYCTIRGILPIFSNNYKQEIVVNTDQYFGHLMQTADSLEKSLMLGKIEGRRRGYQRMKFLDAITDAMDKNSGKLWEMVRDRETLPAAVLEVAKKQT